MRTPEPLLRLIARQDGLLTRAQALIHLSPAAVDRRVAAGQWRRVRPQVYLVAGHPVTDTVRVRAAALWLDGRGVLSGEAAAWWHGMLERAPRTIELTVPRRRGPATEPGVRIRRRDLETCDLVSVRGVSLTGRALTALETAAALPHGSEFLDRALQKYVDFADVQRAFARAVNCRGAPRMRALLIAAADRADSFAERTFIALLRDAGIDGWVLHLPFGSHSHIDIAFPGAKVAVEVDGWAWHVDVDRFRADRMRQNALVQAGWLPLRFTWHDLARRPQAVISEVRRALRRP
ncbi:DUF559 domain-containing protein [Pseudonocardia sp. RS11V-5]|uniref:type IV toxin-antitoxin system AbiEi family antitoxin domain-containing protein n=1 Tax=Pseudonocardia terrae TaxID=2905831 RepID=UPI001E57540B|nr:type IV toxin-antitoxin system AbiEi family antitoxin domain-containing protein [Pseudonocardia terrae]MCE3553806.1 DUF559 domain-containing protein [Pseudonocardia terrae]